MFNVVMMTMIFTLTFYTCVTRKFRISNTEKYLLKFQLFHTGIRQSENGNQKQNTYKWN